MKPSFTIGIEEEYQTIDPVTYDLRSHVHTEILTQGRRVMQERVKAEMHQSVVEVGTGIKPRDLIEDPDPAREAHRVFAARYGHIPSLQKP